MDWNQIFGIAGIFVTIVIAFLIYFLQKSYKYPGKLSASLLSLYRVLGEKPEHYPDLSLKLGDYQVEKNLIYIELLVFNERSYDINADNPNTNVAIKLPKNTKWVDIKVARQSDAVCADVKLDSNNSSNYFLNFPLLRDGESILIEGLIETADDISRDSLFDKMEFQHRIPNVGKVEKLYFPNRVGKKTKTIKLWFSLVCVILVIVVAFLLIFYNNTIPLSFIDKETSKNVSLAINSDEEIVAFPRKWSRRDSYIVKAEELSSRMVPFASYHLGIDHYILIIEAAFMLILIVLFEWRDVEEARRRKRVSKFLLEDKK